MPDDLRQRGPGRRWRAVGVGAAAGSLSGFFGVGGGILIVPGLVLLLRMDQRRAHGTSLAAIVPIAASGVAGYALERSVDWPGAALLSVGAVGGAVTGATLILRISQTNLRRAFAGFLLLSAAALLIRVPEAAGRGSMDLGLAAGLVLVGALSGTVAGLLGVGGGVVMIPAMVVLFGIPAAVAKGTSLVAIIPTALAGTVQNLRNRNADLPVAGATGLAGVAFAFAASLASVRLDPTLSGILFAGLVVAVAVRMLLGGEPGPAS